MEIGTSEWENLELIVESYNPMIGADERWTVRLSPDLDLLIYKEVSNTWFNQRTVRFRATTQNMDSQGDISDYFLKTLKNDFVSLLRIKPDSRVRYSGSKDILQKLTKYLEANPSSNSQVRIGKKNYKIYKGLLDTSFFARPSIAKAIQKNDCALEIQDSKMKYSLIRHKRKSYVLKIETTEGPAFAALNGSLGVLSHMTGELVADRDINSNIRKFTTQYVLDHLHRDDFLLYIPRKLIIEIEPFGSLVYLFKSTLSSFDKAVWRAMHLASTSNSSSLESLIESIEGVKSDEVFFISRNQSSNDWQISWSSTDNIQDAEVLGIEESLFSYLLDNSDDLSAYELDVKLKDDVPAGQFDEWIESLNLVFRVEVR